MRGKQYLTRSEDYDRVYRHSPRADYASRLFILRVAPNDKDISRYGFSISKKVGLAVVRNRIRRRLREIMREMALRPGWDMVFIVRPSFEHASFEEMKELVEKTVNRAGLIRKDEVPSRHTD